MPSIYERFPKNFRQSIDPRDIARLPPVSFYRGEDPRFAHLVDKPISTRDVEKIFPVGVREMVYTPGTRFGDSYRPWAGCWITVLDDDGNEARHVDPMTREDLEGIGRTDARLEAEARELGVFPKLSQLEAASPNIRRRLVFDAVTTSYHRDEMER